MAVPDNDRAAVHQVFMGELSQVREPLGALTKAELRAAVNAIDQWINDNAAALNAAIPQPARAQLTAAQKARLFAALCLRRFASGV